MTASSSSTKPWSAMSPPPISSSAMVSSWLQKYWQDLQPVPGRLSSSLRIVLASVIALILMMVWQMPFASVGLYFIFLIGRDSPSVSLRSSIFSFLIVVSAVAVELGVVIFTDNDPMARLLSVTVVTFIAGMLVVATNMPALGSTWGLIYCTVIALWEIHAPADSLVKLSLWLLATFSVALICAVGVEYIFGDRHPAERLEEQRRIRYQALETMFTLYAQQGVDPRKRFEAASRVSRLAIAGQTGMMELYNTIVDRNLDTGTLPIGSRVRITMLARLMDVSAAFGMQNQADEDLEIRQRCAQIAEQCHELIPNFIPKSEKRLELRPGTTFSLLDRVEGTIHALLTMPTDLDVAKNKELVALPSKKVPFLIPGAIRDKSTIAFGLKISLCATLCYIFYHAVDWPGISTCVITVMVTGLSSSGAIKQRLIFRLLGSVIGGLILGLGATTFLFPYMDSITSLVVLVAFVAFISAWSAGGPKFNYVGLQIAFSFYIVAFEGFSAPTELAPARDRLIGILVALVVMAFVFDQIWPVRTVTVMRRALASVLRSGASLFQLTETTQQHEELLRNADILRDQVGKSVAGIRTMSEAAEYEFGIDREQHIQSSEIILRAALTAAALFWNQLAVLHSERDQRFLNEPILIEMRRKLAEHLNGMAEAVVKKTAFPLTDAATFVDSALLENPRYGEYAHNAVARYGELQAIVSSLSLQM
jgi:multidrug resistance protein MdtO